jgi:hypothetical protein
MQIPGPVLSKNVQDCSEAVQSGPASAVLAEVLRTLELQFQKRGLVSEIEAGTFNPLWFLAETEKNIFLWRHGRSLIEQDDFEFWINVEALVEKRLRQLEKMDYDNPFINPLWEISLPDPEITNREKEYLSSFLDSFRKIYVHANALSRVANLLEQEFRPKAEKEVVLLPEKR